MSLVHVARVGFIVGVHNSVALADEKRCGKTRWLAAQASGVGSLVQFAGLPPCGVERCVGLDSSHCIVLYLTTYLTLVCTFVPFSATSLLHYSSDLYNFLLY
jgi:hypothetical protein